MAWTEKYANFDLATGLNDGSSEANAWQTPAAVIAGVAAGNRVNIKRQSAAYNLTSTVTFNVNGTATAPIWYRAYSSTIGDGGIWECAYNAGGIANLTFSGDYNIVEGVWFKPGASVNLNAFNVQGSDSYAYRCKAEVRDNSYIESASRCMFTIASNGNFIANGGTSRPGAFFDCLFKRVSGASATRLLYKDTFSGTTILRNCVFWGIGTSGEVGVFLDRANEQRIGLIENCRFYNFTDGLYIDEMPDAVYENIYVMRNVFDTMSAYAVRRNAAYAGFVKMIGNYYYNCTSGFTNIATESEIVSGASLSASPFTDTSTGDFTINATSGAGLTLRDAEFYMDPTTSSGTLVEPFGQMWQATATGGLKVHPGMAGVSIA